VEFADEGRGREASSLSVFVLGYVWRRPQTEKQGTWGKQVFAMWR